MGFEAAYDKSPERIQRIVDNAPEAGTYCSDGWKGNIDVVYPGRYIRNVRNKKDTFTVESWIPCRPYSPSLLTPINNSARQNTSTD